MRDCYVFAGQSNMAGQGSLASLPAFPNASSVYAWKGGAWQNPAAEPINGALAGPTLAFGDRMAANYPGREIGVYNCAWNGSAIAQWAPAASLDRYYGIMLGGIQDMCAPYGAALRGVCWYQGESDTFNATLTAAWVEKFTDIIRALRSDLNLPTLPVVFVQLGPCPNTVTYPRWWELISFQGWVKMPNVKMVTAQDLTVKAGDPLHLDTAGLVTLGRRMADTMATMVS